MKLTLPLRLALVAMLASWIPLPLQASLPPPKIHAQIAILFDVNTGEILYKKNDTVPTPVASTQKLLTALIVSKSGNLDAPVTIEKSDTLAAPVKLYLKEGDIYSRRALVQALLVRSPNDVAVALARDNAGSVEAFAEKMNREAKRLGAKQSNFVNPNGLPDPDQISSARDLACIARAAYRDPEVRSMINIKKMDFAFTNGRATTLTNTNRVLQNYSFCNGMKTGYTILSGHCLVASGSAGGRELIAIVLKSNKANVWNDAASLLEYGLGINREQYVNTVAN
jgi:D-alanyl-D-alanine carboxypeptidase (penicillin-binding protein 5/6)